VFFYTGIFMNTVYHRDVSFTKCPVCGGKLKSASFDPDSLHEGSIISCENFCVTGRLKFKDGQSKIQFECTGSGREITVTL
jgi:C4-type Zn-finger protein